MTAQVGALLRQWRTERQFSLGELGRRSGVNKSTLSRWESGVQKPGIPELEVVCRALEVTREARQEALRCIDAPRAVEQLRREQQQENSRLFQQIGPLPTGGDLLRAMRQRAKRTLADTARAADVQASTLSRWEHAELWPSPTQLHSLCYFLNARPEEVAALTSGPALPVGTDIDEDFDALTERLEALWHWPDAANEALRDLGFLAMEPRLWPLCANAEQARILLVNTLSAHSIYLSDRQRYLESGMLAGRALRLSKDRWKAVQYNASKAVIVAARAAAYSGPRPKPRYAVDTITQFRAAIQLPALSAWLLSDLAVYLMLDGQSDQATVLGDEALEIARTTSSEIETHFRRRDLMQLYVMGGRPQDALALLPAHTLANGPDPFIRQALIEVEALLKTGAKAEAHDRLLDAKSLAEQHALPYFLSSFEIAEKRF